MRIVKSVHVQWYDGIDTQWEAIAMDEKCDRVAYGYGYTRLGATRIAMRALRTMDPSAPVVTCSDRRARPNRRPTGRARKPRQP